MAGSEHEGGEQEDRRAEGESNPMEGGRNLQIPSRARIGEGASAMRDMKQSCGRRKWAGRSRMSGMAEAATPDRGNAREMREWEGEWEGTLGDGQY